MNGDAILLVISAVVLLAFVALIAAYRKNTGTWELIGQCDSTLRKTEAILEKNKARFGDLQAHLDHHASHQKSPPYAEPINTLKRKIDSIKSSHQGTNTRLEQLQRERRKVPQPGTLSAAIFGSFRFHHKWKEFLQACESCENDAENVSKSILEADKIVGQIRNLPVVWGGNIKEIRNKNADIERKIQNLELGGCYGQELSKAKGDCLACRETLASVPLAAFQGSADLPETDVIRIYGIHTELNSRLLKLEERVNGWCRQHEEMRKAIELMNQAADKASARLGQMPADLDLQGEARLCTDLRNAAQEISKQGERIEMTSVGQRTTPALATAKQIEEFIARLESVADTDARLNQKLPIVQTSIAGINQTLDAEAASLQHPIRWETSNVQIHTLTKKLEEVVGHTKRTPDLATTDKKTLDALELQLNVLREDVERKCKRAQKLRESYQTLRNERSNTSLSWYEDCNALTRRTREYHASNWKDIDANPHSLFAEAEQLFLSLQDKESLPDDFHRPVPESGIDSRFSLVEQQLSSVRKLKERKAKIADQYARVEEAWERSTRKIQHHLKLLNQLDLSTATLLKMPAPVQSELRNLNNMKVEGMNLETRINNKKSLETVLEKEERLNVWLSALHKDLETSHAQLEKSQSDVRAKISELIEGMGKIVTLNSLDVPVTRLQNAAQRRSPTVAAAMGKDKQKSADYLVQLLQNDILEQVVLDDHRNKTSSLYKALNDKYQKMEEAYQSVKTSQNHLIQKYAQRSWQYPVSIDLAPMTRAWNQLQMERTKYKQTPMFVKDAMERFASLTKSLERLETDCARLRNQAEADIRKMEKAKTIVNNLIHSWKKRLDSLDPAQELKVERKQIEEKIVKLKDLQAHYQSSRKSFREIETELETIVFELTNYTVQINNQTIQVGNITSNSEIHFIQTIGDKLSGERSNLPSRNTRNG